MITLSDGAITLDLHHLLWTNRLQAPHAAGSERPTLSGCLIITRQSGGAGSESTIILESVLDGNRLRGWFTWSQGLQLAAWRDSGAILTLSYDGEIRTVVIPLSGIDITPTSLRSTTPGAGALCTGKLTLIEA